MNSTAKFQLGIILAAVAAVAIVIFIVVSFKTEWWEF